MRTRTSWRAPRTTHRPGGRDDSRDRLVQRPSQARQTRARNGRDARAERALLRAVHSVPRPRRGACPPPLIDFGSYQTDYVKSAHRLGIPVAFLPFSWDNLTNRGLVRIAPDRVLVWNEHQMREAVIYHDIPSNRVVVTGAPRFDDFFAMRPSTTRAEFCTRAGLDPSQRFLLYLCSSHSSRLTKLDSCGGGLRSACRDPSVGDCGILVRPHPANTEAGTAWTCAISRRRLCGTSR